MMAQSIPSPDSFVFKTERPWPNARLKVAAIIGHATKDSARAWLRTGRPGEFSLLVYRQGTVLASSAGEAALRSALSAAPLALDDAEGLLPGMRREDFEVADYAADTTRVVDLQGLDPDTRYGYVLYARDRERVMLGHNRLRRFRTPPAESERRAFQFVLFSGASTFRRGASRCTGPRRTGYRCCAVSSLGRRCWSSSRRSRRAWW